jgi:hypothetical protein
MNYLHVECRNCKKTLWFDACTYTEWSYGLCLRCDARLARKKYI